MNSTKILFSLLLTGLLFTGCEKKNEAPAAPAEPTTKVCPFCQTEIPIKATRCPHCTSELK